MKYFLLETDKKISQLPQIVQLHDKIDVRDIHRESAYKIAHRQLLTVKGDTDTFYPDIISTPVFLLSQGAKRVVEMYEPRTVWREAVLLDRKNEKVSQYFLPIFEEVDCLAENAVFNLNHSLLKEIVLDGKKLRGHAIFRIAGVEKAYIVGNLDVVESMLKRGLRGIGLTELQVIWREKDE